MAYKNYSDKTDAVVFWVNVYDQDKIKFQDGKFVPAHDSLIYKNSFSDQPTVFKHKDIEYDSLNYFRDGTYANTKSLFIIRNHSGIWTLSISSNNEIIHLVENIKFYKRYNQEFPDEKKALSNAVDINDIMESCITDNTDNSAVKNICAQYTNEVNGKKVNMIAFLTIANIKANDKKTNIFTVSDDSEEFKERIETVKQDHHSFMKVMFEKVLPAKMQKYNEESKEFSGE